jgi:hypothetical protein
MTQSGPAVRSWAATRPSKFSAFRSAISANATARESPGKASGRARATRASEKMLRASSAVKMPRFSSATIIVAETMNPAFNNLPLLGSQFGINLNIVSYLISVATNAVIRTILRSLPSSSSRSNAAKNRAGEPSMIADQVKDSQAVFVANNCFAINHARPGRFRVINRTPPRFAAQRRCN